MNHLSLNLQVSFAHQQISGSVTHHLDETTPQPLRLNTRDLSIENVEAERDGDWVSIDWTLGPRDPVQGRELVCPYPPGTKRLRVSYGTGREASGLGWLDPSQTAGGAHPFLYTQGQCDHTRSWIPCVDDPALRITYDATIRVDRDLRVVMAAKPSGCTGREFRFSMPQPIPTYLIAMAVGNLEHRPLGERSGVWTEPEVIRGAAYEFADTESMIVETEKLFGPYRWDTYDLLVLPPGFPLGGMENPRLTFATPTVLAGDRSLVALVAHELAHSWSGNLVTNATWNDFWLNEGFTVYLERRIVEAIFGRERSEMEACLGRIHLEEWFAALPERDTWLHLDVAGRPADAVMTDVPYEKGYLFLRSLEETYGRDVVDTFLREYFDAHAFEAMTTAEFVEYLDRQLLQKHVEKPFDVDAWIYAPYLPADAPRATSARLERVKEAGQAWLKGDETAPVDEWETVEWLQFLHHIEDARDTERLLALDRAQGLSWSTNAEIQCAWLTLAVRAGLPDARDAVKTFLCRVGRRKFLKPLYEALAKRDEDREWAQQVYQEARAMYHPTARAQVEGILQAESA